MLKKIIVGILITALICGGAYGAMIYYRGSNKIPVNVYSVSEIADKFDVVVSAEYMIPENFNSAKALWELIEKLQDEE